MNWWGGSNCAGLEDRAHGNWQCLHLMLLRWFWTALPVSLAWLQALEFDVRSTTGRILAKLEKTAQRGLFLFLCFAVVVPNIPLAMALTLTLPIPIVHSCTPLSPIWGSMDVYSQRQCQVASVQSLACCSSAHAWRSKWSHAYGTWR